MKVNHRIILLVIISKFLGLNVLAQGSWDIKYQTVDSVDESWIGKAVRVDFKSKPPDRFSEKVSIRRILVRRDTVSLMIEGESRLFLENWKVYVDHGALVDQTLYSVDKGEKIIIREMFIRAINRSSIILRISVYSLTEPNKGIEKEITIDKAMVQGVLSALCPSGNSE